MTSGYVPTLIVGHPELKPYPRQPYTRELSKVQKNTNSMPDVQKQHEFDAGCAKGDKNDEFDA
jgi:hypothetical protein